MMSEQLREMGVQTSGHALVMTLKLGGRLVHYMNRGVMVRPARMASWQAQLRSGTIAQITGKLRQAPAGPREATSLMMCCLGVLCDLSGRGTWQDPGDVLPGSPVDWTWSDEETADADAPLEVWDWLLYWGTLNIDERQSVSEHLNGVFAQWNDAGMTFAQIADLIPEVFEALNFIHLPVEREEPADA